MQGSSDNASRALTFQFKAGIGQFSTLFYLRKIQLFLKSHCVNCKNVNNIVLACLFSSKVTVITGTKLWRHGPGTNAFRMSDSGLRRWASALAGMFLVATIAVVVTRNNNMLGNVELESATDLHHEPTLQDLQRRVSKLMGQVRKAGKDAESDASKRDKLAVKLAKESSSISTAKALPLEDDLKEEMSSVSADESSAVAKRKTLQKKLDKAVNDLANAQLKAFDTKSAVRARMAAREALAAKAKEQRKASQAKKQQTEKTSRPATAQPKAQTKDQSHIAGADVHTLELRVQALSGALEALRKLKASAAESGTQGEAYLAELGQRLITMPEVQHILAQSLSAKDLSVAEQIANSLGKNFSANPPVDPKTMAEVLPYR